MDTEIKKSDKEGKVIFEMLAVYTGCVRFYYFCTLVKVGIYICLHVFWNVMIRRHFSNIEVQVIPIFIEQYKNE